MASETVTDINEEDLPLSEFAKRGNARDAGKEQPAVEPAKPVEVKTDTPVAAKEDDDEVPEASAERDADGKPVRDEQGKFKPKKGSTYWRMRDATAKEASARRERDDERRRADRLDAELAALRKTPATPAAEVTTATPAKGTPEYKRYQAMTDAPKIENFEDINDYYMAVGLFIADKRFDDRMAQRDEQQQQTSVRSQWFARLSAEKAKDPALLTKLKADTPSNAQMEDFVMRSEIGVDILKHLSDHQDLAQRISTLHPLHVAAEMGKLEGQLQARSAAVVVPGPAPIQEISQAKPPIKPVDGSPPVGDADGDEENLPLAEFRRRGNKRDPNLHL